MTFQIEDYVHRVGRTGRAGNTGTSYTLFTKKNFMVASQLIDLLGESAEVSESLIQMANLANKVEGTQQRRWRTNTEVVRNVVNVAELLKKREAKALEKQENLEVKETALVLKSEPPKFGENYFQEDLKAEQPVASDQKPVSVVNKLKWGKK